MTSFRVEQLPFRRDSVDVWGKGDSRYSNWPVVYTLDGSSEVYVGESLNAEGRLRQHLDSAAKNHLRRVRVVIGERFNKSVCLDLESYLIRLLAGDGQMMVLNRNEGITNANYYGRDEYQATFREVFDELRALGMFSRPIPEIENSDLFKLSPFKALTSDQAAAIEGILDGLFEDLAADQPSQVVIQGDPGTGKTVVGIYLVKLLSDIREATDVELIESDSRFSEYFLGDYPELLAGLRIALVVPQQSLRRSVKKVFEKTPGLDDSMVLSPFDVGLAEEDFDLLIVDETHRLNHRANQSSGQKNIQFREINERLFGADDAKWTQADWITRKSRHQIFLVDAAQSVRPADLPRAVLDTLVADARAKDRVYPLASQLRVEAGPGYVDYVRQLLSRVPPSERRTFPDYDLRFFDDPFQLREELLLRDAEFGLARMVAGYAWRWKSKGGRPDYDIEIGDFRARWNRSEVDWVSSSGSINEVGSIHTIQGYDLNYAGVLIGKDLRYDPANRRILFDRSNYFDAKGMENNRVLGITYDEEDLLRFVTNIYGVLLTRGIRGTYVYVADPAFREHLRPYF